jgi:uncharacterized Zn finger protein (UPF0148 family)
MKECSEYKKNERIIMDEKTGDVICPSCGTVLKERSIASFQRRKVFAPSKHLFYGPEPYLGFDEMELSAEMKASIARLKSWVSFKSDSEKKVALAKVLLDKF